MLGKKSRAGAPTLVPVKTGGSKNKAQIFVLKNIVTIRKARNMLWRRETHKTKGIYRKPAKSNKNAIIIKSKRNFHDIDVVLYTKIEPNINPLAPKEIARLAIESARSMKINQGMDGISYLIQAKRNGVHTPLMDEYERAILEQLGSANLEDALHLIQKASLTER